CQPVGDVMRATLTCAWPEFTRPANSSMRFGLVPAAATTAGAAIRRGIDVRRLKPGSALRTLRKTFSAISAVSAVKRRRSINFNREEDLREHPRSDRRHADGP